MERRKYWWNADSESPERCDIVLYEDGGRWWMEIRIGGGSGRSHWREFDDEDAALDRVYALMAGPQRWHQID